MRRLNSIMFAVAILLLIVGCSKSLPDAYGIYTDTNHGQTLLTGQNVIVVGNMLSRIPGLKGPSGFECRSLKDFVIYKKDVNPDAVSLVRLNFMKEVQIQGMFGSNQIRINLWLPKDRIEIKVKPVTEKKDMYFIVPKKPLEEGFYALYIGPFGGEMGLGGQVYDVVVGSSANYLSYTDAVKSREIQIKSNASNLLTRMNELLSKKDFGHLEDVYRPEGEVLSGSALQEFAAGNQTWISSAGKVLNSEITSVSASDDGQLAHCSVKTTYEKAGVQIESMTIKKIGERYFITELK